MLDKNNDLKTAGFIFKSYNDAHHAGMMNGVAKFFWCSTGWYMDYLAATPENIALNYESLKPWVHKLSMTVRTKTVTIEDNAKSRPR